MSDRLLVFYLDASPSDSSNVPYVASICRSKSEEFSSFLQARLSCKIGDFSFSNLNAIRETKSGIFASFTTSSVYFRKSVLCFYDFDSIKNQMKISPFLDEKLKVHLWPPKSLAGTNTSHPAECAENIDEFSAQFISKYSLLEKTISTEPIWLGEFETFGSISTFEIDEEVIFIGTDKGRLIKISKFSDEVYRVLEVRDIFDQIEVCGDNPVVKEIKLVQDEDSSTPNLFIAFENCIITVPAAYCNFSCEEECEKLVMVEFY